eukprot:12507289-Heterocapsa_arctica.AAC.1
MSSWASRQQTTQRLRPRARQGRRRGKVFPRSRRSRKKRPPPRAKELIGSHRKMNGWQRRPAGEPRRQKGA